MFAARDQENLVHGHHQIAAAKPLNQTAKTPGNRYPKTPLKVPLHDENAPTLLGGKSILGTKGKDAATFDKNAFITPMGKSIGVHHTLHIPRLTACDRTKGSSTVGTKDDQRKSQSLCNSRKQAFRRSQGTISRHTIQAKTCHDQQAGYSCRSVASARRCSRARICTSTDQRSTLRVGLLSRWLSGLQCAARQKLDARVAAPSCWCHG